MFKLRARMHTPGSLLAIGVLALATAVFPPIAPTAQAAVACPTAGVPGTDVGSWGTAYNRHGVALCEAFIANSPALAAKLQIVDLTAGAKLLIQANYVGSQPSDPVHHTFYKRYMPKWAEDMPIGDAEDGEPFFSVTNASFFTDTTHPTTTTLSLPMKLVNGVNSYGIAINNSDPPNSTTPKRVLRFNDLGIDLNIGSFPAIYNASDAQCAGWDSCLVGFAPLSDPSGNPNEENNRTFVGVNTPPGVPATRAYIITTKIMTVAEVDAILQAVGADTTMQLDGGGSTGMQSVAGHWLQTSGPQGRAVPVVMMVRYAP